MLTDEKEYRIDLEVQKLLEILNFQGWKDESYTYVKKYRDGREEGSYSSETMVDSLGNRIYFHTKGTILYIENKKTYNGTNIPLGKGLIRVSTQDLPLARIDLLEINLEDSDKVREIFFYKHEDDVYKTEENAEEDNPVAILSLSSEFNRSSNTLIFPFDVYETTIKKTRIYSTDKNEALEFVKNSPERCKYTTSSEKQASQAMFSMRD